MASRTNAGEHGFTLIELLVVLAIVALLMTISVPRYFRSVDQSKEAILKENLHVTRAAIDSFYGDNGRYPLSLSELVERGYLRAPPLDPITDSQSTWILVPPASGDGVFDIRSGAAGRARSGLPLGAL